MIIPRPHALDVSVSEAREIQERMRREVRESPPLDRARVTRVAGTDLSYLRDRKMALGVAVLMSYPDLELLEVSSAAREVSFPYVPGLLSFRELPALLPALEGLSSPPDLVFVDGQGLAHPRRFGLASHLGVLASLPTIGCAKSRLLGEAEEPGPEVGDWSPLRYEGETVGAVLRTRRGVKPLYVSVGHLLDLASCMEMVLSCTRGFRLPEPQRRAHLEADRLKREVRSRGDAAFPRGGHAEG